MNAPPRELRRPPYWLFPVFAVLMLSPTWATVALAAMAVGVTVVRGVLSARSRHLDAARSGPASETIVLGTGQTGEQARLSDHQLSAHGLIVGASGAGKSTTLLTILTEQVRRGRPVVAIDLKGSPGFARELASAAATVGRPFGIWTPDGPNHWNPLQHGNPTELKDKLIATERFTEPHYQRAAERYIQTVLQVLEHANSGRAPTLEQVVRLMDPHLMPGMLRGLPRPFAERVQDYIAGLTPDQLSAIRGLGTRLAIISESHTGRYLSAAPDTAPTSDPAPASATTIDLRKALDGPEVVLFSLNSSTYGKLAGQIGTLVVQDLVAAVGHRLTREAIASDRRARSPATVGIDEFSALEADHLVSLLARGREAGVSVLVATQELADLDRAAPGVRDQVLGNTAVKIAHRQDVPASAHAIAQMVGTEKVWEHTEQTGNRWFGGYDTGRGTRRRVEQFVVHPDEIKRLGTGQAVVITKLPTAQARTVRVTPPRREGPEIG